MSEQTLLDKFLAQYTPFSTKHGPVYDLLYTIAKRCQECEGSTAKMSLAAPVKLDAETLRIGSYDIVWDYTTHFGIHGLDYDTNEIVTRLWPFGREESHFVRNFDFYAILSIEDFPGYEEFWLKGEETRSIYLKVILANEEELDFPVQVYKHESSPGLILHTFAVVNAEICGFQFNAWDHDKSDLSSEEGVNITLDIHCNYDHIGTTGVEVKNNAVVQHENFSGVGILDASSFVECLDKDGKIMFVLPPGTMMVDLTGVASMRPDDVTLSFRKLE